MQEKIHRMTVVLVCLVLVGAQSFLGCSMLVMSIGGNVLFKDSHGHSLVEIHPGKLTDSLPFPFQSYIEENRPEPSFRRGEYPAFPSWFHPWSPIFCLQQFSDLCGQATYSREDLASHFRHPHFNFRLIDSDRIICSICQGNNDVYDGLCHHCGGINELWIYVISMAMEFNLNFNKRNQRIPPRPTFLAQLTTPTLKFLDRVFVRRSIRHLTSSLHAARLFSFTPGDTWLSWPEMFLGIYFTTHKEYGYSMGDSLTLAGFVLAVGSMVCSFLFAQHYRHCECWEKNKLARTNSDASDAMALNEIGTMSRVGHANPGGGRSIRWDDR